MEQLPISKAQPASLMFAESSIPNQSVHFSFNQKGLKKLNCRIPAIQLSAMIENLKQVQECLEESGVDTGRGNLVIPAAPYGFFDQTESIDKTSQSINIGSKPIRDGDTVQVDHNVSVFSVSVRSLSNIGTETIKNLIEKKYEVTDVQQVEQTFMVHKL